MPTRPRGPVPPTFAGEVDVHTGDGRALRADVYEPHDARGRPREPVGVAVLAHAVGDDRRAFGGARGLAASLAGHGLRVVAFDFRAHGDAAPARAETRATRASRGDDAGATYDDLVRRDLPAVAAAARDRAKGAPLVVVGHGMGGLVALASMGSGELDADGLVTLGASVWLEAFEPSPVRAAVKRGLVKAARRILGEQHGLPGSLLRGGPGRVPHGIADAVLRPTEDGAWRSDDGRVDYRSALGRVRVPSLALASDGDGLEGAPACVLATHRGLVGPWEMVKLTERPLPSHEGLVRDPASAPAWARVATFVSTLGGPSPGRSFPGSGSPAGRRRA